MDDEPKNTEFQPRKFFASLWHVTAGLAARPTEFFTNLSTEKRYWPAVIYLIAMTITAIALTVILDLTVGTEIPPMTDEFGPWFLPTIVLAIVAIVLLVLVPLIIMADVGITHLGVLIFAGAQNKGFNRTFKAVIYVTGFLVGPSLLTPYTGPLELPLDIGIWVWGTILTIIGVRALHLTDKWRAALAVVIPQVVAFVLVMMVAAVIFIGLIASFMLAGPFGPFGGPPPFEMFSEEDYDDELAEFDASVVPMVPTVFPEGFSKASCLDALDITRQDRLGYSLTCPSANGEQEIHIIQSYTGGHRLGEHTYTKVGEYWVYELELQSDEAKAIKRVAVDIDDVWIEASSTISVKELQEMVVSMEPITADSRLFDGLEHGSGHLH